MADSAPSTPTVADVMTPSPRTCSPFSTVLEALMIFRDAKCHAVPVVDAEEPVGILTESDIDSARVADPDVESRTVAEVMTKGVVTIAPDAPLAEVEAKFEAHGVNRLLVVGGDGLLRGIVTRTDLAPRVAG